MVSVASIVPKVQTYCKTSTLLRSTDVVAHALSMRRASCSSRFCDTLLSLACCPHLLLLDHLAIVIIHNGFLNLFSFRTSDAVSQVAIFEDMKGRHLMCGEFVADVERLVCVVGIEPCVGVLLYQFFNERRDRLAVGAPVCRGLKDGSAIGVGCFSVSREIGELFHRDGVNCWSTTLR